MIEFELSRIMIDEQKSEQMLLLKEKNAARFIPIVVGINEAVAIRSHLSGLIPPRPMTHDLLAQVITGLSAKLQKILIDNVNENVFYAKLQFVTADNKEIIIDARPSDSIALAVRLKCPIFVTQNVVDKSAKSAAV